MACKKSDDQESFEKISAMPVIVSTAFRQALYYKNFHLVKKKRANLSKCAIAYVNLECCELRELLVRLSSCTNLTISGCDLRDCTFTGANIADSDFSDSNLSGANFNDVTVSNSTISDCSLKNASFVNANLVNCLVESSALRNASLDGVNIINGTFVIDAADVSYVEFAGASITDATLQINAHKEKLGGGGLRKLVNKLVRNIGRAQILSAAVVLHSSYRPWPLRIMEQHKLSDYTTITLSPFDVGINIAALSSVETGKSHLLLSLGQLTAGITAATKAVERQLRKLRTGHNVASEWWARNAAVAVAIAESYLKNNSGHIALIKEINDIEHSNDI